MFREKPEEQLSSASRKKVTFDSKVRTYEPISVNASIESLPETTVVKAKEKNSEKSNQSNYLSLKDSKSSNLGSFPQNHRYGNCGEIDDEEDEMQFGDSDLDVEDDEYNDSDDDEDEDADILGSNTKISPAQVFTEEIIPESMSASAQTRLTTIGANPNARDRSAYVHPVLNPVENLSQWKALKGRGTPPLKLQKENLTFDQEPPRLSFSMEPSFKQNKLKINETEKLKQEIEVNASLSNWLVSAEPTAPSNKSSPTIAIADDTLSPQKGTSFASNSPRSLEDRPILGALTLEEIRQFSASNSPRRSPSRSPDDMPILGTVGTYWSHTGSAKDSDSASSYKGIPNTTSKYREV